MTQACITITRPTNRDEQQPTMLMSLGITATKTLYKRLLHPVVRVFDFDRSILAKVAQMPQVAEHGLLLGTSNGTDLYSCKADEQSLVLIIAALGHLFDQCANTVRHKNVSMGRWLRSQFVDRLQKTRSQAAVQNMANPDFSKGSDPDAHVNDDDETFSETVASVLKTPKLAIQREPMYMIGLVMIKVLDRMDIDVKTAYVLDTVSKSDSQPTYPERVFEAVQIADSTNFNLYTKKLPTVDFPLARPVLICAA
jgi:hypothetical protein